MFHEESLHQDDHISLGKESPHALSEEEESIENANARAVFIAGEGEYTTIRSTLREEGLIEREMQRVEREYALREIPFLNERDREMFTVLDLYDPATARHCFETYQIARKKIEKEIIPGVSFARLLEE